MKIPIGLMYLKMAWIKSTFLNIEVSVSLTKKASFENVITAEAIKATAQTLKAFIIELNCSFSFIL